MHQELERAGYAVFAITYDRQVDLKAFADKQGIDYPILSDEGSRVIRELGILDEDLEVHHARFAVPTRPEQHGVAYPMTFVLDETGRIERKIVEENYRSRYGGRFLLGELTRAPAARGTPGTETSTTASQAIVSARAWLDSPTYSAYQRLGLHVEVTIQPGWHVYGPEVPPGYTGLRVEVQSAPPGVRSGRPRWPDASPFRIAGLDEQFSVYEGTVEITDPVDFVVNRGSGPVRLEISLGFQVCSDTECLPPATVSLLVTVPEGPVP